MTELIADKRWHDPSIEGSGNPPLNYSVSYEAERPDAASSTVRARFTITMRSLYENTYFYFPLYCKISINNTEYTITDNFGDGIKSVSYTTDWIEFSNTGTSLVVGFTCRCGDTSHTYYDEATITFGEMSQYATFLEYFVKEVGLDSITIQWAANADCDRLEYSLNDGEWIVSGGWPTFIIEGVSPNTYYRIKTRIKRTDSQLWTESGYIQATTYDIAKISSASNFDLGSSASVTITNPTSATATLAIKVGTTQILSKNLSTGANTINFTDTELDNIYKQFALGNTVTVSYVLTTNSNSSWTNTKTVTCTLKGNQKTGHVNVNGTWRRTKHWVNVNGSWKRCVRWVNVNGTWRRCI